MGKFQDLTGMKFGQWTVLRQAPMRKDKRGYNIVMWHCVCDCGTEKDVYANSLRHGTSTSCGCHQRKRASEVCSKEFKTHGESTTRLYHIWAGMLKRCENQNASNYSAYGARGVSVCDGWHTYTTFRDWAMANGYNDDLSIDRIDVDGNYEPQNCRWANVIEQANNRRSSRIFEIRGVRHTLAEWARLYDVDYKSLHKRIMGGESIQDILGN